MGSCCCTGRRGSEKKESVSEKAQTAQLSALSVTYSKLPPQSSPSIQADPTRAALEGNEGSCDEQTSDSPLPMATVRARLSEMADTANGTKQARQGSLRKRPSSVHEQKFLPQSGSATSTGMRSATLPREQHPPAQMLRSSSLKGTRTGSRPNSGLYAKTIDANALRRTLSNGTNGGKAHSTDEEGNRRTLKDGPRIQARKKSHSSLASLQLLSDRAQSGEGHDRSPSINSCPIIPPNAGTSNNGNHANSELNHDEQFPETSEELSFGQPAVLEVTNESSGHDRPGSTGRFSFQSSLGYGPGQYVEQHLVGTSTFGELELGFQVRGQGNRVLAIDVRGGQNIVFRYKPTQLPEIYVKCYLQTDDPLKVSKKKTKLVPGSSRPHFDEVLVFSGDFHNRLLKVMVWEDHGMLGRNCMLGEVIVDLALLTHDLRPGLEVSGWYSLFAPYSSEHSLSSSESFASLISSENSPTPSRIISRGNSKKKVGLKPKKLR